MLKNEYGLSPEKTMKIAIFSYEPEVISQKISKILKRKYTVFHASTHPKFAGELMIDLFNSKSLEGFLAYYGINLVLICSSILDDVNHHDRIGESILKMIRYCSLNGIKPVMLLEKYRVVSMGEKGYQILGKCDWYSSVCKEISENILHDKNGLVIKCPAIYGYDLKTGETDLLKFLDDREKDSSQDRIISNMEPLLLDEVAEVLSSSVCSTGLVDLCDKDIRAAYFGFSDKEKGRQTVLKQKGCAFNLIYQLMPNDYFGGERVAKIRLALGERLATCIADDIKNDIDYIVPVPKTGLYYAMGLSKGLQIPYMQGILKDNTEERSFQLLDVNARKKFLKTKLSPLDEILGNKSVMLVDEAIFTGTTLKMACRMLREIGVEHIYLGIPTPPCYVSCDYYVQPKREMLLEYIRYDMLAEYFDVDGICFQTVGAFMEEIPEIKGLCTECFTGR